MNGEITVLNIAAVGKEVPPFNQKCKFGHFFICMHKIQNIVFMQFLYSPNPFVYYAKYAKGLPTF